MKNLKVLIAGIFILSPYFGHAQNTGIGTTTPNASAMLDIESNSKGLLIPRLTQAQRNVISNPATGLLIFQTDNTPGFYYNNGLPASPVWLLVSNSANSGWLLNGNTGTNAATNFIGTTDNQPLKFRVSNYTAGFIGGPEIGSNLFMGIYSGGNNTSGTYNTAYGRDAFSFNTSGYYNSSLGAAALRLNTTGERNTAVGAASLTNNSIGYDNSAVGYGSLNNNLSYFNTAIGSRSLFFNTTGHDNAASGYSSLYSNTTASFNTAHGAFTLYKNTVGEENVAVGYKALENNVNGYYNVAVGNGALGANINSGANTAVGYFSLAFNFDGYQNTAQGYQSLSGNISGGGNVAIGFGSLQFNSSGNNNIAIGRGSGSCSGFGNVNNSIVIGANTCTQLSNYALLGTSSTVWNGGNTTWSTYSDARLKKDIREDVSGLSFILKLRPVTYNRNISVMDKVQGRENANDYPGRKDLEKIRFSGFLAQEVEIAAQQTGYNFSGVTAPKTATDFYSLSYESFVVPLVKAVQEQQILIEKQSKLIDELLKRVAVLESKK